MAYKRISPIPVNEGGSGALTLTGVLTGNGTSAFTASAVTQFGTVVAGASNAVSSIAPSATSGIPYISQGAASNPTFGTAVVAGGGTGSATFNINGVVISGTTTTSALTSLTLTSGQIVIGGTTTPAAATLSAGAGIAITNANNSITIAATGAGFTWTDTTVNATIVAENGYIADKAGLLTMTLPASPTLGDEFAITNINTAVGFRVAQNANQQIRYGTSTTTTGATGYLEATALGDTLQCVCTVGGASARWQVISSIGNITVN